MIQSHSDGKNGFQAASPSAGLFKRTGKYSIPSVAKLGVDSFLIDDAKRRSVSFSLGDETVNSHALLDYINDTVDRYMPTRRQSKQNPEPVLFSSKSPEQDANKDNAIEFANKLLLETLVVVYEPGRKGRIVKERSLKQGRKAPQAIQSQVDVLGGYF